MEKKSTKTKSKKMTSKKIKNTDNIVMTVAMPVFNSKNIVWLAMEGLASQKDINFSWELIIAEETENAYGKTQYNKYKKRLETVGCKKIKYIKLDKWIPLPQKWVLIANNSEKSSIAYILQASDCYSEPQRLKTAYDNIVKGDIDWLSSPLGCFYDIHLKNTALFRKPKHKVLALNMSTRTKYVKQLPVSNIKSCVDSWMYENIVDKNNNIKVGYDESDNWKYGIDTHGLNNISNNRGKYISNLQEPFEAIDIQLSEILPKKIVDKLTGFTKNNNDKINLIIISCAYKRHCIFNIFAKNMQKIKNNSEIKNKYNINVLVVGNENKIKNICADNNIIYKEHPNSPLSNKWNYALSQAKQYNPDYVMVMGSDDLICLNFLKIYHQFLYNDIDFIGIQDIYFHDMDQNKMIYYPGYSDKDVEGINLLGESIGAGRCFSKKILDVMDWKIWDEDIDHSLDFSVTKKLRNIRHSNIVINLMKNNIFLCDLKTVDNMGKIEKYENQGGVLKDCNEMFNKYFLRKEIELIEQYKPEKIKNIIIEKTEKIEKPYINNENKKKDVIDILIRSSNNPEYLRRCIESIKKQTNNNYNIIIGTDNIQAYHNEYKYNVLEYERYMKNDQKRKFEKHPIESNHAPDNICFNNLIQASNNKYIMFMDDNCIFISDDAINQILLNLQISEFVLWRVSNNGNLIPNDRNFINKKPVCCDISGVNFAFNSKYKSMAYWDEWSLCSYRVAERLYNYIENKKYINKILIEIN